MVQRMIGSQQLGTGGSSGYQYLKSTLRYLSASINGKNQYKIIYLRKDIVKIMSDDISYLSFLLSVQMLLL